MRETARVSGATRARRRRAILAAKIWQATSIKTAYRYVGIKSKSAASIMANSTWRHRAAAYRSPAARATCAQQQAQKKNIGNQRASGGVGMAKALPLCSRAIK